ncbi:MAG: AAA family ATPase [Armatimonadetes bacterium]|nr:AAA family ATPase [Armatimonadota bacterium]
MSHAVSGRGMALGTGRMYPAGSIRDTELAALLASYKRDVTGAYTSVSPDDIASIIPAGRHVASTKIDGEQWFLCKDSECSFLVSPNGKVITGVPVTEEADRILSGWVGVLAGELYATVGVGRPRVFDLHSALGGGADAQVERLRFATFDILQDVDRDCQSVEFDSRATRIRELLGDTQLVHPADFTRVDGPVEVRSFFENRVDAGEEGVVVCCNDGRIFKVKPRISIDAAVVAYTELPSGVGELLLALMPEDQSGEMQTMQIIGRVDIGFSQAERRELADRLGVLRGGSVLPLSSRSGLPYQWVRPEMVVEIQCHELLTTTSDGESIRRWRTGYSDNGWQPLGKAASISMRDAVFIRVCEDKIAALPDIRWSQVTDIAPLPAPTVDVTDLPKSEVIRREVYTKAVRDYGVAVRKIIVWQTNKDDCDPRYPAYAAMFTDYSPARQEPIRTELRVASSVERITTIVENWLAENVRRGWDCVAKMGDVVSTSPEENVPAMHATGDSHSITISFARSTSPTFPIVHRRLDALAEFGNLSIINLLSLVRRWKSTEVALDGDTLDKYTTDDVLNRLEEIRQCWNRHKATGPAGCERDGALGCRALRITPSQRLLDGAFIAEPPWYAVGKFEGERMIVDKAGLISQVDRRRNKLLDCCPCFSRDAVLSAIQGLPDVLSTDDAGYQLVYKRDDGLAAWVWPEHAPMPRIVARGAQARDPQVGSQSFGLAVSSAQSPPITPRMIQPATYADVCGQDEAVEAVRDLIELPMKHAPLFEAVGVSAKPSGVILAGPPGTDKTLLARAIAGECGAHLEIVSGPELLNPYVGATEQALREVFERAGRQMPSLILFDELDAITPSRATADAHHQQSMVAQLLALLDGLESRNGVFVLATTNRPKSIDAALRRPGRFDRVVWMKLPDECGRAAILRYYLKPLKMEPNIDIDALVADLAEATDGASGADLEYLCQTAARICVKEAITCGKSSHEVTISAYHFDVALSSLGHRPARVDRVDRVLPERAMVR